LVIFSLPGHKNHHKSSNLSDIEKPHNIRKAFVFNQEKKNKVSLTLSSIVTTDLKLQDESI
jgi:hypothetical protein